MIIVDIETSGVNPDIHGVLSIGAVHFESGNEFYTECRPWDRNFLIEDTALAVNGFTREKIGSIRRTDSEGYSRLLNFAEEHNDYLLGGHNIGSFDALFLRDISVNAGLNWKFGHRFVDLHSLAYARFGQSLKMDEILVKLGLPSEPKPHNALTGAKCEAEAFRILLK